MPAISRPNAAHRRAATAGASRPRAAARAAALAMTFGEHLAGSVRGLPCAPPSR